MLREFRTKTRTQTQGFGQKTQNSRKLNNPANLSWRWLQKKGQIKKPKYMYKNSWNYKAPVVFFGGGAGYSEQNPGAFTNSKSADF